MQFCKPCLVSKTHYMECVCTLHCGFSCMMSFPPCFRFECQSFPRKLPTASSRQLPLTLRSLIAGGPLSIGKVWQPVATSGHGVAMDGVSSPLRKAQVSLLRALLLLQGALQCTNKLSQDVSAKFHHFAMVSWSTGGVGWLGLCFGSTTQRRLWPLPIFAHCSCDRPSFAETAVRQRLDLPRVERAE